MSPTVLTQDTLNRTLLARQGLLTPHAGALADTVEAIGAIQAQYWPAVAISLITRNRTASLESVYDAFERRELVVGSSIRGTVHAVSRAEHPLYAAVSEATDADIVAARNEGKDPGMRALRAAVLEFAAEKPRGAAEFADFAAQWVEANPGRMSEPNLEYHQSRNWRPIYRSNALIRFPSDGRWAPATGPKTYLYSPERAADPDAAIASLVRRHLAAFGPAAADDTAAWLGLKVTRARPILEGFTDLVTYTDEAGRILYDLPDAELADPAAKAPPRLLPRFDSILLAHNAKHRQRIISREYWERVYNGKNLQILPSFLIGGYVAGIWSVEAKKKTATLTLEPFHKLAKADAKALTAEAERVLRSQAPDSASHAVVIAD
ncbi:winged helix DNA-binding domain-containing protein [Catenulispora pinisilvae]|uniref:winged helix DNA-binding domain-containing protein n=1 Tax=Catenulispora pinisilvae TaxID=2705253 RepID=UPI0018920E24|nr:winged helix DNA-binding domain-containing protein [Catenulispora pinisilvae]